MLKPRALTSVLAQANSDGVESTFLFKQDGTLLAHASVEPGFLSPEKIHLLIYIVQVPQILAYVLP